MVRRLSLLAAAIVVIASWTPASAIAQSSPIQHGLAANREYAAVFAHSDDPCSVDYATAPYVQCMNKELAFVEAHLDAFVEDVRGLTGSAEELASLNGADTDWRAYRESFCSLPLHRFGAGTIKGPMSVECQLRVDRAYMKQLSGMYILSQFPKDP